MRTCASAVSRVRRGRASVVAKTRTRTVAHATATTTTTTPQQARRRRVARVPATPSRCGGNVEVHALTPYATTHTRVLLCGSFLPVQRRMCFYYPNPSNDMWGILGALFFGTRDYFYTYTTTTTTTTTRAVGDARAARRRSLLPRRGFDEDKIRAFMCTAPVGFCDVARQIRRRCGNASDDNLDVVEACDVCCEVLPRAPHCVAIVATGALAFAHLQQQFAQHGGCNDDDDDGGATDTAAVHAAQAASIAQRRNTTPRVATSRALPVIGSCCPYTLRVPTRAATEATQAPACVNDDDAAAAATCVRRVCLCRGVSTSRACPRPFAEKLSLYRALLAPYCTLPH